MLIMQVKYLTLISIQENTDMPKSMKKYGIK